MNKVYEQVKLPDWIMNANQQRLLEHIKYLTHENDKHKRLYRKKLREVAKLRADQ